MFSLVGLFSLLQSLKLINSFVGLILVDTAFLLPFAIWLLTGFLRAVSRDVLEAAALDGAGSLRRLKDVVVPLAVPSIIAVGVFAFIEAWNEFVFAQTLLTSQDKEPLSVGIFAFAGRYGPEWNKLMAAAVLATIPVILLFALVERRLTEGLAAGAER